MAGGDHLRKEGVEAFVFFFLGAALLASIIAPAVFSAHYVNGTVLSAPDGYSPDNMTIFIFRYSDGRTVNLTTFIGVDGQLPNEYQIDCNESPVFCEHGDIIQVNLRPNGSGYEADPVNITVNAAFNSTLASDLKLAENLPPNVTIQYPTSSLHINGMTLVNATVSNRTLFNVSRVIYMLGNSTANYTGTASVGYSSLPHHSGFIYNCSFNATLFANGDYTLFVIANNTHGARNISKVDVKVNYTFIDLVVSSSNITLSDDAPSENVNLTFYVNVSNRGNTYANDVVVQFFRGDYLDPDNQMGSNMTKSIPPGSYRNFNMTWDPVIGNFTFYVVVDPSLSEEGDISETDESNNIASRIISVPAWHIVAGNMTGLLELGDEGGNNIIRWIVENANGSNIFICDSDSTIHFDELFALSRTSVLSYDSSDFADADIVLNMTGLNDSISSRFMTGAVPKDTDNFTIFGSTIKYVPVINSTNSSYFRTGILWDSFSDDDGSFDYSDQENLVMITKVKPEWNGKYGVYNFEIAVPASIREYKGTGSSSIAIYTEVK